MKNAVCSRKGLIKNMDKKQEEAIQILRQYNQEHIIKMLKKYIAIIIFVVSIVLAGFFESHYIVTSFDFLENELYLFAEQMQYDTENIDTEENIVAINQIRKKWQDQTQLLEIFVWHTIIKEIENSLSRITSYVKQNDFKEAYTELNSLIDYSEYYSQDYRFSFQNVV